MTLSLLGTVAVAALAMTAAATAYADPVPMPLTPDQLRSICKSLTTKLGTIEAAYSYANWEGVRQDKRVKFTATGCLMNGADVDLTITKAATGAPPFRLNFGARLAGNGVTFGLSRAADLANCTEAVGPWSWQVLVADNFQLTEAQKRAIETNSRTSLCPAMVKAITTETIKRLNGIRP
jgi:hypothetical protein